MPPWLVHALGLVAALVFLLLHTAIGAATFDLARPLLPRLRRGAEAFVWASLMGLFVSTSFLTLLAVLGLYGHAGPPAFLALAAASVAHLAGRGGRTLGPVRPRWRGRR